MAATHDTWITQDTEHIGTHKPHGIHRDTGHTEQRTQDTENTKDMENRTFSNAVAKIGSNF